MTKLVRMTITERERYVRWWMEAGLGPTELGRVAAAVWGMDEPRRFSTNEGTARRGRDSEVAAARRDRLTPV